jgi:hypothetical protein
LPCSVRLARGLPRTQAGARRDSIGLVSPNFLCATQKAEKAYGTAPKPRSNKLVARPCVPMSRLRDLLSALSRLETALAFPLPQSDGHLSGCCTMRDGGKQRTNCCCGTCGIEMPVHRRPDSVVNLRLAARKRTNGGLLTNRLAPKAPEDVARSSCGERNMSCCSRPLLLPYRAEGSRRSF